jgi:glycosyltransferase involved in cell wall biosynthesis
MLRVLSDEELRKNLITLGLAKASNLSWDKTANETLSAYNKIIKS